MHFMTNKKAMEHIKYYFIRKTKNRNIPKIKKNNSITKMQIVLYPISSLWVNMIYVIAYTKNHIIVHQYIHNMDESQ
jgi:hypothetical protein